MPISHDALTITYVVHGYSLDIHQRAMEYYHKGRLADRIWHAYRLRIPMDID